MTNNKQMEDNKTLEQLYIDQLSAMEKIVLKIAEEHLETSFSLKKSIGFKSWLAEQLQAQQKQAQAQHEQKQAQQVQAEEKIITEEKIIRKKVIKKKKLIM